MNHFKYKLTGCWLCKDLKWEQHNDPEDSDNGIYYCDSRDDAEEFKTFPCVRRLKCFTKR